MDFGILTERWKKEKPVLFLSVIENTNHQGIQTYFNPLIKSFNEAYKSQLITFLEGVIKELKKNEK